MVLDAPDNLNNCLNDSSDPSIKHCLNNDLKKSAVESWPFKDPRKAPSKSVATYLSPSSLANYLPKDSHYYLFLDIDGTLAQFTLDPKDSYVPKSTVSLIQQLQAVKVDVAVVTGRSLAEAKQMLNPLQLPIAATHGHEVDFAHYEKDDVTDSGSQLFSQYYYQYQAQSKFNPHANTRVLAQLKQIKQSIINSCQHYPQLRIEDKPLSCAVHYREHPSLAQASQKLMLKAIRGMEDWELKQGKYVWEAVPKGMNKGTAIMTLLIAMCSIPTDDKKPVTVIFIGDDVTDEAGFKAINSLATSNVTRTIPMHGMSIKVGNEFTSAGYYLHNTDEVAEFLQSLLTLITAPNLSAHL